MRLKTPGEDVRQPNAEEIAIAVLTWLANEPEMLSRFLALTGTDAGSLRDLSASPAFAAALLEFVLAHEPSLMAFSAASGIAPQAVEIAWRRLAGPSYGGTGA